MNDEIRIPIEIDDSKGLVQLVRFKREIEKALQNTKAVTVPVEVDKTSFIDAMTKLYPKVKPIPIDIDSSQAKAELQRFTNEVRGRLDNIAPPGLRDGSGGVRVPIKVDPAGSAASLGGVASAANNANSSLRRMVPGVNEANFAMTNLGRVLQDSPFGFIGIANNLNPLLESFQRLKTSAGTTGGAMKALGGALRGAGGLGLAVSALTAILSFSSMGLRAWGASSSKAKAEADDLKNKMKELASAAAGEMVKLTTLVGLATNVNASYENRRKAIAAINQEYKEYLKGIGVEEATLGNIASAYDRIIDSMLRQAVVKGLQAEITKEVEKTAAALMQLELTEERTRMAQQKNAELEKNKATQTERLSRELQVYNRQVNDGFIAQERYNSALQADIAYTSSAEATKERLKKQLMDTLQPLMNLTNNYEDLGIKLSKVSDKSRDVISRAKELSSWLREKTLFQVNYEFSPMDSKEEAIRKAQAFLDDVSAGRLKLRTDIVPVIISEPPPASEIEKVKTVIEDGIGKGIIVPVTLGTGDGLNISAERVAMLDEFSKKFQDIGLSLYKIQGIDLQTIDRSQLEAILAAKKELLAMGYAISDIVTPAFTGLFDAIASGKNPIEAFVDGLKQAITDLIRRLIAAVIQASILAAITGGKLQIGRALKGVLGGGGVPFADGGLVTGPVSALVGEGRGTNRSNPEVIMPLDRLKNFFAGMLHDFADMAQVGGSNMNGYSVALDIPDNITLHASGDSLVGVMSLTQRKQSRGG